MSVGGDPYVGMSKAEFDQAVANYRRARFAPPPPPAAPASYGRPGVQVTPNPARTTWEAPAFLGAIRQAVQRVVPKGWLKPPPARAPQQGPGGLESPVEILGPEVYARLAEHPVPVPEITRVAPEWPYYDARIADGEDRPGFSGVEFFPGRPY